MEGKRIKSAWEIALEKADSLGELSDEELAKRQEEEYTPVGQALAKRFLSGLPLREVQQGLASHEGYVGRVVKRAALATLVEVIEPNDCDRALPAVEAIRQLLGEENVGEIADSLARRLRNGCEAQAQIDAGCQESLRHKKEQELKERGIFGSAVSVNVEATAEWREVLRRRARERQEVLLPLKKKLLEVIGKQV
ncbi:MAG: hypothetical protein HY675_03450 [Chloroflexi bacterium]|nr:hypothetical protein [Chloroflexota bacterium]